MGSSPSKRLDVVSGTTPTGVPRATVEEDLGTKPSEGESATSRTRKISPPKNLSGPALIEYRCRKKKNAWISCTSNFYKSRFLTGEALGQDGECEDLFELYKSCYVKGMLKERQRKGLGPPREGTLLAEFIEEIGTITNSKD